MNNLTFGTQHWVERINAAYDRVHATWRRSVEDIIHLGKELLEARKVLPKGAYTNMLHNELAFSAATATKLIKIAESEQIFSNSKIMPPHWETLYSLSRLDPPILEGAIKTGVIRPEMERSEVPVMSRNLSVGGRPRGRPRKPAALPMVEPPEPRPLKFSPAPQTIEGAATEVEPEALPVAEPPPLDRRASMFERKIAALEAENAKLRESPPEPEIKVQPFGSGDSITITFPRDRPAVNFWQGLLLALGEWTKLGSLEGHDPTEDTLKSLVQYDLGKFIGELDLLRDDIAEGVFDAA